MMPLRSRWRDRLWASALVVAMTSTVGLAVAASGSGQSPLSFGLFAPTSGGDFLPSPLRALAQVQPDDAPVEHTRSDAARPSPNVSVFVAPKYGQGLVVPPLVLQELNDPGSTVRPSSGGGGGGGGKGGGGNGGGGGPSPSPSVSPLPTGTAPPPVPNPTTEPPPTTEPSPTQEPSPTEDPPPTTEPSPTEDPSPTTEPSPAPTTDAPPPSPTDEPSPTL